MRPRLGSVAPGSTAPCLRRFDVITGEKVLDVERP